MRAMRSSTQESLAEETQLGLDVLPAAGPGGASGGAVAGAGPQDGKGQGAACGRILTGDARRHLAKLPAASVDLSFWSPPYYVGKSYERHLSFDGWCSLLREVIHGHARIIKPGGFLAVNIGDILCFPDPSMPRFQANNRRRKKVSVTKEQILAVKKRRPNAKRQELADLLGCSEQTIQRRLEDNNVRGGKQAASTKVLLTGCMVAEWAEEAGFYLYDQRIWHKDPCWANSRWHSNSYRAVDEFEHIYVFWRPGITDYDRNRLNAEEWANWGSRGVWSIRSVSRNHRHEAEFPEELAARVIRLFSPPGGVVLDPFVGTGTTTAVAKKLGRQWLGIDLDPHNTKLARRRTHEGAQRGAALKLVATNSRSGATRSCGRRPLGGLRK